MAKLAQHFALDRPDLFRSYSKFTRYLIERTRLAIVRAEPIPQNSALLVREPIGNAVWDLHRLSGELQWAILPSITSRNLSPEKPEKMGSLRTWNPINCKSAERVSYEYLHRRTQPLRRVSTAAAGTQLALAKRPPLPGT
jgi:hypothetical protein